MRSYSRRPRRSWHSWQHTEEQRRLARGFRTVGSMAGTTPAKVLVQVFALAAAVLETACVRGARRDRAPHGSRTLMAWCAWVVPDARRPIGAESGRSVLSGQWWLLAR